MEYRPLDITVMSAEGLKNVNMFMKMGVYVVISLSDDSISKKKTHVSNGGSNPKWNHRIKMTFEEASVSQKTLLFQIKCNRILGDKDIGEVMIPVQELLDGVGTTDNNGESVVTYTVRTLRGKSKGNLKFSYKFGETFVQGGDVVNDKKNKGDGSVKNKGDGSVRNKGDGSVRNKSDGSVRNKGDESVMAYAASNMTYQPQPGMIYALPQTGAQYSLAGYPAPQGYPAYSQPPQQYGGGYGNGYAPTPAGGGYSGEFQRAPPSGYIYQPQQMGYGYSGEYPRQQLQQPTLQKMGSATKLGLGLGAGLIGGLLVGNMISDIGDMAAAGCDAGLED